MINSYLTILKYMLIYDQLPLTHENQQSDKFFLPKSDDGKKDDSWITLVYGGKEIGLITSRFSLVWKNIQERKKNVKELIFDFTT